MNQKLRDELLAMKERDEQVRARLADEGSLSDGYHADMEAVQCRNAAWLVEIIEAFGGPGLSLVGADSAEAASLIAQHAISERDLQRRFLTLLQGAVEAGDAPPYQAAYLEDRIRVFEGRKQRYGTQIDYGLDGAPRPFPIEDPDHVDARRSALGLQPLSQRMAKAERVAATDVTEHSRKQQKYEAWLRRVGWRS